MAQRFALKIAYLGWNYQGFQRQKEPIVTVEGTILKTLTDLSIINESTPKRFTSAGRTDKGVHALSQVIAFDSPKNNFYLEELNKHLPADIFAWGIANVKQSFNPRRDALKRTYKMFYPYSSENIELMKEAVKELIGTHDFMKLSKKSDILPSGRKKSTILTLDQAEVNYVKKKNILEFTFKSRSFLWHQVRKMVSLILAIGAKKHSIEIIQDVLNPKSKLPKGGIKPVVPDGLILFDIYYPEITFKIINKKELIESKLKKQILTYTSRLSALNLLKENILNNNK